MPYALLSDCFLSDSLEDVPPKRFAATCDLGAEAHWHGLVRGTVFALALSIPLIATAVSAWLVPVATPQAAASPGWVAGED